MIEKYFVMYRHKMAERTLQEEFMTPYLKQAQWAEVSELKRIIGEVYQQFNRPLKILDIGVGNARIPVLLSEVETWDKIKLYIGIDNSQKLITLSRKIIKERKLGTKVKIIYFDGTKLQQKTSNKIFKHKYDLIICTYFTAGDFKPKEIKIAVGKDGLIVKYNQKFLKPNNNFVAVFKGAFKLLNLGGEIILGSTYIDNKNTRGRQEDFYRKCGMQVITSENDSFVATKEGFWSQRFTKKIIYNYFSWIKKRNIKIIPLDDYNFAQMVVISK